MVYGTVGCQGRELDYVASSLSSVFENRAPCSRMVDRKHCRYRPQNAIRFRFSLRRPGHRTEFHSGNQFGPFDFTEKIAPFACVFLIARRLRILEPYIYIYIYICTLITNCNLRGSNKDHRRNCRELHDLGALGGCRAQ